MSMPLFAMQLAAIIIAARVGAYLVHRFLRLPPLTGELTAGMIIGPYALGAISLPVLGPLFPLAEGPFPVSPEIHAVATLASILLLFLAGLETDLPMFIRYSRAGMMVGLGGVIGAFALGAGCAIFFGVADSVMDPVALFLGAIATATSVGITARVLTEKRKSDSPEGVTVMSAAILDDVLGIVLLAVVVGIVHAEKSGGHVDWADIGLIAAKAFGFWIVCTGAALLAARRISRLLKLSRTPHIIASVSLGLALLLAGLSEMAGLAMIIGAYIMGLSLSRTDLVQLIRVELEGIYNFLVPAFFCVMGMLVDVTAMQGLVVFGLVYSALAILSKLAGCGLPAWWMNFNLRGALRIGVGMAPRGEVALIMAGVGLASGAISSDILGVAVMMTMISTLVAPVMLIKSFEGGSGVRGDIGIPSARAPESVVLDWPAPDLAEWMTERLAQAFRREEFFVYRLSEDVPSYQVRKDQILITLTQEGPRIILSADPEAMSVARFIVLEELIQFQALFETIKDMRSVDAMRVQLITEPENNGRNKRAD